MALTMPRASQINFDLTNITDPIIRLNSGESGSADKDTGIVLERGSDTNVALLYDESANQFALVNTNEDGTTSGNVTIASYAPIKISNLLIADDGNIGSASDTDAIAIAADGVVTMNQIPVFSAGINVSGGTIAGTLATVAQTNITSLGTLTALTVDDVVINGKVVTITGDTDDTFTITAGANGATTLATVDGAYGGADGHLTLDPDGIIILDSGGASAQIQVKAAGTEYFRIFNSGSNAYIKSIVSDGDLIIQGIDGGSGISALTFDMSAAGAATFNDDVTVGDDLKLASDSSRIFFGADSEVLLTHIHDSGLRLTNEASGDNVPVVFQLKSEEDFIVADEVIGSIEFAAGDNSGTDAATVAAGIHAIAEGEFTASANATKLVFTTGVSETAAASATAKMTLSSAGLLTIADDFVIKDGGTIGSASDADAIAIAADGIVTFSQAPALGTNKITGVGDPTASQDAATKAYVDSQISSAVTTTGTATLTNKSLTAPIITGSSSAAGSILFKEDTDNGTNAVTLIGPASTADVTVTLPAATDTLIGKATTDTLTNKTINGPDNTLTNIANSSLSNSAITVARQGGNSTAISLGGTITFTNVSNETTVAEDSGTITIGLPATVAITTGLTVGGDTATTNTATQTLTNKTLTSPALTTPTVTTSITLNAQADLKFADADSSHYVAFQAPNTVASNVLWTLPGADGTEDQVLSTNGSGTLAWADAGSGGSSSGSSFPNSTVSTMPGSAGDYDLQKNTAQDTAETPFEAGGADAFGVNLGTVYSMMDPAGTTTTVDLGTLS